MFKPTLTRLIISCVLLTASNAAGAVHLSDIQDNLIESWESETDNSLRSSSGTITGLASLDYSTLCKDPSFAYSSERLEYSYNATGRVELFVVDRSSFEARLETGDGLVSEGVILPDSYCLGETCKASCSLTETKDWCLVFWNVDKDQEPVNVTYLYHLSGGTQKSDQLVLILTLVCVGLALLLFGFIIGCCVVNKRRRKSERSEIPKDSDAPQQVPLLQQVVHPSQDFLLPMPPPPPPPLPVMVPSGSHHSIHDAYFQTAAPLPMSHVPQSSGPPGVLSQEVRAPITRKDKRSKKPKSKRIRFPI